MLNIVTGKENMPQAVLIRGLESINGPGRITKHLMIDQSFYATNLIQSEKIWIESNNILSDFITTRRIGIEYAGEWKDKPWRYVRKIE